MRRFPARESRWRVWLPEDASRGAVPFQEANRSRRANRRGVGDVGEQPGGAAGPGAVQARQGSPAGGDQPGEFLVQGPGLLAGRLELAGQPGGEPAAGLAGQVPRPDGGDQRAGLPGGAELLGPAGQQLQQEPVQPAATWVRAWPSSSRRPASMPVTTRSSPGPDLDQARSAQGGQRDRVRTGRVGLAAVPGGEHPHLRGQLRRHAGHDLAVMNQAVRQVPADAVAALHRPDPVRELPRRGQHVRIPGLVRAVPARRQHYRPPVDDLDRGRALVRVHPDDHAHSSSRALQVNLPRGGHCYFELGKPLSSLSPHGARRDAGHE